MFRLADYRDPILAEALAAQLVETGITAKALADMTARGGWRQGMSTVWVNDQSDLVRARAIQAAFERETAERTTEMRCRSCGYDLQGHSGKGVCPECGKAVSAAPVERPCPHCGEDCPSDFAVCWNCDGLVNEEESKEG